MPFLVAVWWETFTAVKFHEFSAIFIDKSWYYSSAIALECKSKFNFLQKKYFCGWSERCKIYESFLPWKLSTMHYLFKVYSWPSCTKWQCRTTKVELICVQTRSQVPKRGWSSTHGRVGHVGLTHMRKLTPPTTTTVWSNCVSILQQLCKQAPEKLIYLPKLQKLVIQ